MQFPLKYINLSIDCVINLIEMKRLNRNVKYKYFFFFFFLFNIEMYVRTHQTPFVLDLRSISLKIIEIIHGTIANDV